MSESRSMVRVVDRATARRAAIEAVTASRTNVEAGKTAALLHICGRLNSPAGYVARPCRAGVPTQSPAEGAPAAPRSGDALI